MSLPFGSDDDPVACTATCAGGMEDESGAGDESGLLVPSACTRSSFLFQRLCARPIHVCNLACALPACTSLAVHSGEGMSDYMFVPRSSRDGSDDKVAQIVVVI